MRGASGVEVRAAVTAGPGATGWLLIAIGSLVPLVIGQLMKIERLRSITPRQLIPQPTGWGPRPQAGS